MTRNRIFDHGGKQWKYYFSWTATPKLFQPVRISPLVIGLGTEAKTLFKFLEDPTFVDSFGWEVVTRNRFLESRGMQWIYYVSWTATPKLLQPVWISPLVIGLGTEAKTLFKFLEDPTFVDSFGWEVVTRNRILDHGECSEYIMSLEPQLQNCSNLFESLHWS